MLLLFGGMGFLGSHVGEMAANRRVDCAVLSRQPRFASTETGFPIHSLDDFDTKIGDALIERATSIVYLASGSVPGSNPTRAHNEIQTSVGAISRLCRRILDLNPAARLIYCSSGGTIYGPGHSAPIQETAPANPVTPYALGKQLCEANIEFFGRTEGLRYSILRIANPAGHWQRSQKQGLIGIAMRCAMNREPLTIFGDGCNQRDYFDADDFSELVFKIDRDTQNDQGIWNVGSGIGRGEYEVIEGVSTVLGRPIVTKPSPARDCDLRYAVVDPTKAKRDFGWTAKTPFLTTLGRVIEARKQQNALVAAQ